MIQGVNIHATPINSTKVEAPITGHLRDYVPYLEKYEAVQNFLMWEDKNQEDCKIFGNFIPWIELSFLSQNLARTYYHCLEFCHIRSF